MAPAVKFGTATRHFDATGSKQARNSIIALLQSNCNNESVHISTFLLFPFGVTMNLDEKITRRQAMQEQTISLLRSTTNKVCKMLLTMSTLAQAKYDLNEGIRGVRNLIRRLENDPTDMQVADDIRTSGCVVLNSEGKYIVDAECVKATFGESSDHYMLANQTEPICFPYDGFPYPCLLYTSPSPRDKRQSRMPSSA